MTLTLRSSSGPTTTVRTTKVSDQVVIFAEVLATADSDRLTSADGETIAGAIRTAREKRLPFVLNLASAGVSTNEGIGAAAGWATAAHEMVKSSGIIPTAIAVVGPVVSGPALLLGLADIIVFAQDAYAFVSGPQMIETYTGVPISAETLGGSSIHNRSTGVASLTVDTAEAAMEAIADVLSYLPSSVDSLPPLIPTVDPASRQTSEAGECIPSLPSGSYDVRKVIRCLADDGDFLETKASWAPNLVTGFASFGGRSVGIVANQTQALAGAIDIPASQKGARFVAMCDSFNLPILTMVDTSGFLPGKDLEWRGMIRHGAQLAFAYARATVPRIGLILRKSYGGAYIVMDSRNMGNDLMFAWPTAEVAVMGAKGAVEILHRNLSPEQRAAKQAEYEAELLNPYKAAERSSIAAVISPDETRKELVAAFDLLANKRERLRNRRHDNSPL